MRKLKKGFTLIELLVVIAIIGILATVLAPKLREQLAKAKDAKVVSALGSARTILNVIVIEKTMLTDDGNIKVLYSELDKRLDQRTRDILTPTVRSGGRDGDIYPGGSKRNLGKATEEIFYDKPLTLSTAFNTAEYNGIKEIQGFNSFNAEPTREITVKSEEATLFLSPRGGDAVNGIIYSTEGVIWTQY